MTWWKQLKLSLSKDWKNNQFGKLWQMLGPFHATFGWFVVLLLVYEGLQIGEGYVNSLVVRFFGSQVSILAWVGLFALLLVFDEVFMRLDNRLDWQVISKQSYPVFKYLKMAAITKFLSMEMPWHQQHNSGALVGKVSNGVGKVAEVLDGMSWEFVPTFVQTVLSLIPLLILSRETALVAVAAFVIFLYLTKKSIGERREFKAKRNDLYEEEWHRAVELVQSVETSLMFGQQDRVLSELSGLHDNIISLGLREAKIGVYKYNRWRIRFLSYARRLVLLIWVSQLHAGVLDVANFIFVATLTEKLFSSFWRFARLFDRLAEAMEPVNRLATLLSTKSLMADGKKSVVVSGPVGISLSGVNFAYGKEYNEEEGILHDLTLDVPAGKIIALVGPSGAGKTTIRKLVARLVDIQSGTISVAGLPVEQWRMRQLRALFSYVPQGDDVAILARTIGENIAFPKPEASRDEVVRAAQLAGIDEFIKSLPDGYDTQVGERGKRLSGGQKQRVALARAILADAPILILDEATSAVDAITEQEIQTKMQSILSGKTAIIIAHRLSTIWDIADRIVVLDQGRIIEQGSHASLVRRGGLYAKMVALQTAESV